MESKDGMAGANRSVTQEQVASDFDRLTESYEQDINRAIGFAGMEHAFFIDKKRDKLLKLTARHFGSVGGLAALDLGCGLGAYHPGLKGVFRELHGADVSQASVKLAAERHPFVKYAVFDGMHLPFPNCRFDVVFAICVMHHVPPDQWTGFVSETHRALKPGGLAMIFEHNPYNPATQYIVRSCDIDKDAVLLRPGKLRGLFRSHGFHEIATHTMFSVPPSGRLLSLVDDSLGYLPFGAQYYLRAVKR